MQEKLTTQLTSTARQRRNATDDRVVRVFLRSREVQALQALGEDVHDLGSHFADIGILHQLVFLDSKVNRGNGRLTLRSTVYKTTSNHARRCTMLVSRDDVTATPTDSATMGERLVRYEGFMRTNRLSNRSACWLDWSHCSLLESSNTKLARIK